MTQRVSFRIEAGHEGWASILPVVDGSSLVSMVAAFEESREYFPAGGYGGAEVTAELRADPLSQLLRGRTLPDANGRYVWLLGCDCGITECWPLVARVVESGGQVVWTDFQQPFREQWSYADFGPFTFDRDDYVAAAEAVGVALNHAATSP